ncbi:MAG: histidine phosphatase family protein [bacterium]
MPEQGDTTGKSAAADTRGAEAHHHYGLSTTQMVADTFDEGVERGVLFMRHSARTFDREIHDLLNPLTDHGRGLSQQFGTRLPKDVHLRGYASPPERCMETAELVLKGHAEAGGQRSRVRALEALGVFYALDQQKMWKGLSLAQGLPNYVEQWFADQVPQDAMMPAPLAVRMILRALVGKLRDNTVQGRHLDVCVSHDMSVYTLRHGVGLEPVQGPEVEFLDGLLLFEKQGHLRMRSQHGGEVAIDV